MRPKWRKYACLLLAALTSLNSSAQNYFNPTGKKYPIVAWHSVDAAHNTRAHYMKMAKAGFNLSLSDFFSEQETRRALKEVRGTGVKLIVNCQEGRNASPAFINDIKGNTSVGLYYICDEPIIDYFEVIKAKSDRIMEADGFHYPYVNLLPSYADKGLLGTESYANYLYDYIEIVHPSYISFDHYPFVRDSFRNDIYDNLEIVSEVCKDKGIPFWGFARTLVDNNYHAVDEGRLRFQVFINIAYGAQGIQYFSYAVTKGGKEAIVDSLYKPTEVYETVKKINKEVHSIENYVLGAELIRVLHVRSLIDCVKISHIKSFVSSGNGVLISQFEKDGIKLLMVVNKDFENNQHISVTFSQIVSMINKKGRRMRGRRDYEINLKAGDWRLFKLN